MALAPYDVCTIYGPIKRRHRNCTIRKPNCRYSAVSIPIVLSLTANNAGQADLNATVRSLSKPLDGHDAML
jgi:hypothetical protein